MTQTQARHAPRYAMVTPVYNEGKYIAAMIESVCGQTIQPAKWVIVDDGSTDNTAEIAAAYARRCPFMELIRRPKREERLPGGERAIQQALGQLDLSDYDFLARFDADLIFEPDYIEQILAEFERDPRLGIAGGGLYIEKDGHMELELEPAYHVRGAVKMYRRQCFEQIGGLATQIGWDTIDEVYAWTKGWKTRSFFQYRVSHRRPTGFGLCTSRIYFERGKAEYFSWSSPLFVLIKTAKIALGEIAPLKALRFLAGFICGYLAQERRIQDPLFVKTRRDQQRHRLMSILSLRGDRVSQQLRSLEALSRR
ncbi:MAG: glycosyltransferase family A protein [Terriglobales bacterium]